MKPICMSLLLAMVTLSTMGQDLKVAVVDIQRVMMLSDAGKTMQEKMDGLVKEAQATLSAMEKELQELSSKAQQPGVDEATMVDLKRQFEDKSLTYKRMQEDKRRELQKVEQQSLQAIEAELVPIMEAITEENGYHMLVNTQMESLVWSDPSVDITEAVIKKYNSSKGK